MENIQRCPLERNGLSGITVIVYQYIILQVVVWMCSVHNLWFTGCGRETGDCKTI